MPDIYFSYPQISGNEAAQKAYQELESLLGGGKEKQAQGMKLIFQHHPAEALPGGEYHEDASWNSRYLGTKWLNMWLDEGLIVESAWDVPFEFYLHLYAYLWKFDPYVHLSVSFTGNDEGEAHWIYEEQFTKRISEEEILKTAPPNHPNPQSFYQAERDKILHHFRQWMNWREWAADEIGDLLEQKRQESIESFQVGNLSFKFETLKEQAHWKAEHRLDPNFSFTLIYEVDEDGNVEDNGYDGPGGEYLENHPQIWNLFQEFKFPVPKPKTLPPPIVSKPKILQQPLSSENFPDTAEESALKFLELLVEEQYLELNDSDALPEIANQISELFETDISDDNRAYQIAEALIEKLLTQDYIEDIYLSDEELAERLLKW